jgi:kynurenine formamidase
LLTRGILADVAGHRGTDMQPGEAITADELRAVLAAQHVDVRPGDIVMVRTGWARYWGVDNDRYMLAGCPGISLDAARWLAQQGVIAVGADQAAVEVWPAEREGDVFPVHVELLTRSGVYLIEQANLEQIASERLYEFLIVCATPKFAGATGSPVRLLAVA